jgi:hypothetical protein
VDTRWTDGTIRQIHQATWLFHEVSRLKQHAARLLDAPVAETATNRRQAVEYVDRAPETPARTASPDEFGGRFNTPFADFKVRDSDEPAGLQPGSAAMAAVGQTRP